MKLAPPTLKTLSIQPSISVEMKAINANEELFLWFLRRL
jgi:hypothetical protein